MLCDKCGQRQASVHVTKIVNNDKTEQHLCAECARNQGDLGLNVDPPFSVQKLLGELLNYEGWFGAGQPAAPGGRRRAARPAEPAEPTCEGCGLTYRQFTRAGLLGCARCYERFSDRLEPLLRRLHGASSHTGKVPQRRGGALGLRRRIEALRRSLVEAVAAEEYEKAARLRDQIREVEAQLARNRGPHPAAGLDGTKNRGARQAGGPDGMEQG